MIGRPLIAALLLALPVTAAEPEPKVPLAGGAIDSIDFTRRVITLTTTNGPATFAFTDRTVAFNGTEKIPLHTLRPGDRVKLRYAPGTKPLPQIRILKLALPDAPPDP